MIYMNEYLLYGTKYSIEDKKSILKDQNIKHNSDINDEDVDNIPDHIINKIFCTTNSLKTGKNEIIKPIHLINELSEEYLEDKVIFYVKLEYMDLPTTITVGNIYSINEIRDFPIYQEYLISNRDRTIDGLLD